MLKADLQAVAAQGAQIQHAEAEPLAHHRGGGGAHDAHMEHEDEQRVQADVQHGPGHQADHGEEGVALEAHLVVEHAGGQHERRAEEQRHVVSAGVVHGLLGYSPSTGPENSCPKSRISAPMSRAQKKPVAAIFSASSVLLAPNARDT